MSIIKLIDQIRASSALRAAALNNISGMDGATLASVLGRVDDATLASVLGRVDAATLARVLDLLGDTTLARALDLLDDTELARVLDRLDAATLARALGRLDDTTLARVLGRLDDTELARVLDLLGMTIPVVAELDARMLAAAESGNLDMSTWHCGTTHCRAGWAVVFGCADGARLKQVLGTEVAGRLIYEASTGRIAPDFYAGNDAAIADIRACAALTAS